MSCTSQAADDMARFYDAHQHKAPKYNVVDKVWLSLENVRTVHPMKKLNYKWLGPYVVEWVISCSAYWLKLPTSFSNIHPIFSVTLLHPFKGDLIAECQECWNTSGKAVLQGGSVPDMITFFLLFLLLFSYPPKGTWVRVVTYARLSCLTPTKECN